MKKILTLIGSRSNKSNTVKIAEMAVNKIIENNPGENFEHELLKPEQWNLLPCISCNNCFSKGFCVNDEKDGMKALKAKLLDADVIIMGSPVFAAHVSGDAKHLIDRLSLWLHTMPLIGRYGITLSTTSGNNGDAVIDYLGRMMELMGLQVVMRLNAFVHMGDPLLHEKDKIRALMREPVRTLSDALFKGIRPTASELLRLHYIYQSSQYIKLKKFAELYPAFASGEQRVWEEQGYQPHKTIEDLYLHLFDSKR